MLRSCLTITILENTERARLLPSFVRSEYARLSRKASEMRRPTLLLEVLESPIGNMTSCIMIAHAQSTVMLALHYIDTRVMEWFMKSDGQSIHHTLQVQVSSCIESINYYYYNMKGFVCVATKRPGLRGVR